MVNQNVWFEGETKFADIVLPACTNLERWDIAEWANCSGYIPDSYSMCNHRVIVLQKKCIEPLGESKSDYQIFAELAKRLGIWEIFTDGGKTEYDWVKQSFAASDLPKHITWEEFEKKGYYVVPPRPAEHTSTPAFRWFAEDRKRDTPDWGPHPGRHGGSQRACRPPAGKIEFVSSSLTRFEKTDGVDPERPVMGPQYLESWEGHHTAELVEQVPAADDLPAPALLLPHHGRRQADLDQRGQGPPGAQGGRPLLLDHAAEPGRRGRPRRRGRRPHPGLQRPGLGDPRGAGHRAPARRAWCTPTRAAPTIFLWASPAAPRSAPAA